MFCSKGSAPSYVKQQFINVTIMYISVMIIKSNHDNHDDYDCYYDDDCYYYLERHNTFNKYRPIFTCKCVAARMYGVCPSSLVR